MEVLGLSGPEAGETSGDGTGHYFEGEVDVDGFAEDGEGVEFEGFLEELFVLLGGRGGDEDDDGAGGLLARGVLSGGDAFEAGVEADVDVAGGVALLHAEAEFDGGGLGLVGGGFLGGGGDGLVEVGGGGEDALGGEALDELEDVHAADGGEAGIDDSEVDGVFFHEFDGFGPAAGFESANTKGDQELSDGAMPRLAAARVGGLRRGGEEEVKSRVAAHRIPWGLLQSSYRGYRESR